MKSALLEKWARCAGLHNLSQPPTVVWFPRTQYTENIYLHREKGYTSIRLLFSVL